MLLITWFSSPFIQLQIMGDQKRLWQFQTSSLFTPTKHVWLN